MTFSKIVKTLSIPLDLGITSSICGELGKQKTREWIPTSNNIIGRWKLKMGWAPIALMSLLFRLSQVRRFLLGLCRMRRFWAPSFAGCSSFKGGLSFWNVSCDGLENAAIPGRVVSNAKLSSMFFAGCSSFDRDLAFWNVSCDGLVHDDLLNTSSLHIPCSPDALP